MNDSSFKEVAFQQGTLSSFLKYPSLNRILSSKPKIAGHKVLRTLTVGYRQLLERIDPQMVNIRLPHRVLSHPSEGVRNNGLDNVEYDYILRVKDQIINEKKHIFYIIDDLLGKGTFGQVAKCHKENTNEYYAIKIIKNQAAYNKQCLTEIAVLKSLHQQPNPNIITLYDQFVHKQHICLLFPLLSYTLLDLLKDNRYQGLGVRLSRRFISIILKGLQRVEECGVVHADLKPENIMIQEDRENPDNSIIQLIDFGSSCFLGSRPPYTYIQSRFYRAPEIILRFSDYTSKIDLWSLGCIAVELIQGIALFPGADEYTCLSRILDVTEQELDVDYIKKSEEWQKFFTEKDGHLWLKEKHQYEHDAQTKVKDPFPIYHPIQKLRDLKPAYEDGLDQGEPQFDVFLDFIRKLLAINPKDRMNAMEAMDHQFIVNKSQQTTSYEDILQMLDTDCDGKDLPNFDMLKQQSVQKSDVEMSEYIEKLMSDDETTPFQFESNQRENNTVVNLYEHKFKDAIDNQFQEEDTEFLKSNVWQQFTQLK